MMMMMTMIIIGWYSIRVYILREIMINNIIYIVYAVRCRLSNIYVQAHGHIL